MSANIKDTLKKKVNQAQNKAIFNKYGTPDVVATIKGKKVEYGNQTNDKKTQNNNRPKKSAVQTLSSTKKAQVTQQQKAKSKLGTDKKGYTVTDSNKVMQNYAKKTGSYDVNKYKKDTFDKQRAQEEKAKKIVNNIKKGDTLNTVTKKAGQAARNTGKFLTDFDYRNKVGEKALMGAGTALSQFSKGALKTVENWGDAARSKTDDFNNWVAYKTGIIDKKEYDRQRKISEESIAADAVGDFWKNNLGWNEENAQTLKDYSYVTEDNLLGQLSYGLGQQAPALMIGNTQAVQNLMTNPALQSVAGDGAVKNIAKGLIRNAPMNLEIGARSYGGAVEEALQNGATMEQARRYGLLNAGTEIATEWMTGGIPGVENTTGLFDKGVDAVIDKATGRLTKETSKAIAKSLLSYGFDALGEGLEESVSEIFSPLIKNMTYSNGEKIDWNSVLNAGIMGMLQGGILNAPSTVANARSDIRQARQTDRANQEAARQQAEQQTRQELNTAAQSRLNEVYQQNQENAPIFNQQNRMMELAQQQVQAIQQQVQSGQISPQEGIRQIENIQRYITAQQNTQMSPTTDETQQSNAIGQEQQNIAQNANNEVVQNQQQSGNLVQDYMNDNYESLVGDYIDQNYGQQQESNLVEDYMNNGEDNLVNDYMNNYEDGNMVENFMNAQNELQQAQRENIAKQSEAFNLNENKEVEKAQEKGYNKTTKEEGVENEFRRLQEESRRMSSKDTESFHSGQRQIDEGIRNRLSRVLGGRLQTGDGSLWNGNSSIVNQKTGKNIEILENVDPKTFKDTFEIVQKYLPNGDAVDVHDVKSSEYSTGYEDTKNFLSKDGLSGFAITKDGDLISVFNLGEKGYLKSIKDYVKKNGAKTLDCYQSEKQPLADMYNKTLGFKTASLMDFNYDILVEDKGKEYADYFVKTYGEAPVAFMIDTDQNVETKHFNKDQYDEALNYRNSYLKNEGTSDSSFSNEKTNIPETKTEPVVKQKITGKEGEQYYKKQGASDEVAKVLSENPKEERIKLREKLKNIKDEAYRLLVSNRAELERIAKVTNRPDIVHKHDKAQRYEAEANHHIAKEQTNLNYKPYKNFTNANGEKVSMSLNDIRKDAKRNNIPESTLNEYLAHYLNTDRYLEGKPVFGDSVTNEDSLNRIEEIEKEHPEIKRIAQNVWQYEHNELNNAYQSGLISKDFYEKIAKYEHYVRIQRNVSKKGNNNTILDRNGKISINQGIQAAKGGNQDILPIMEGIAKYTVDMVKNERYNKSGLALAEAIGMGSQDESINSIEDEENFGINPEIFKQNDDGTYTMTVFNNGVAKVVPINKAIYDAYVKNKTISAIENSDLFKAVTYPLKKVSSMFRTLTTNDNLLFMATNAFKDIGDAPFNSKYMKEFTEAYTSTKALREVAGNGGYNKLYNRAGGSSDSYFVDGEFKDKTQSKIGKAKDKLLTPIEKGNEVVESTPRMAEFIATIKANGYDVNSNGEMILKDSKKANGRTAESVLDEALYNAAEVTTNFKRGGDLAKSINRNGGTFFNASIQGFDKQVRNFKDAFTDGDKKKIVGLLLKALIFGVAPTMLNDAMNDDDDEYKNMQDYLKDNYYLFKGKDGNYIRIPKGRAMSVIGSAYRRTKDFSQGNKDAFKGYAKFASGQVAPNNPFENNIIAPFFAVKNNKSWSGSKIVSQSMEKRPAAEQYNEKTDKFSKWLGGKINVSPMKINYLIDQYTGGIGDVALPMITPKATSKSSNPLVQPFVSKFTTDSVYQQKSVGDFYDAMDKAETKKYSIKATKEDKVKYSYLYSQNQKMAELYKEQRAIQADENISKKEKYEQAREIQKEINELAEESVKNSNNIKDHKYYATIGDNTYYLTTDNDGNDVWAKDGYADKHKASADKKGVALYDYYKEKYEERKAKKK